MFDPRDSGWHAEVFLSIDGQKKIKLVRILGRLTGGPARQACMLHQRLASDYDTRLVFGNVCEGESDMSYLLDSDVNIFRIPQMSREISLGSDLLALWKIYRLLCNEHPDIVHTHTAKAGTLGRIAAFCAGVPVIVHTYHGHVFKSYFGPTKTKMFLTIERLLARVCTRVITISQSQRWELCKQYHVVSPAKTAVICNGFDLQVPSAEQRRSAREDFGLQMEDFVFVWAARMAPVKDVQLLAEVVRKQSAEKSRAFFLVVGDGEERSHFETLIKGCDNVKLLGWQRDMGKVWAAADAAILTSRNEGTPTALIEAMAAGLPFVSTNVGGVNDLAVEPCLQLPQETGVQAANGFLTARTKEALCYGIDFITQNRSEAAEMGAVGMSFVTERFGSERLLADLNNLYQDLLAGEIKSTSLAIRQEEAR
jgi:glycosyltransferase involved in cell wall biosynthesis